MFDSLSEKERERRKGTETDFFSQKDHLITILLLKSINSVYARKFINNLCTGGCWDLSILYVSDAAAGCFLDDIQITMTTSVALGHTLCYFVTKGFQANYF